MLEFQHVSKTFKNQEVLHDINMEIHDGEFVVLIGPSGCGKTTSLKMINRLIAPSKGQILLNGSDIRNEDVIRLRRNMGYVIQQTGLFPHMNIEDNMEVIAKLEHVEQAQRRARTRELMEMVGLDYAEFSQRYPQELREINSPAGAVPEVLNFSENCIKSETMLAWLSERQIYVSSASACGRGQPSHTLAAMGRDPLAIDTAIRVSFCADNTPEDVDAFLERFEDGMKHLQRIKK